MNVAAFTKTGSKSATKPALPKGVFGVEVKNSQLLAEVYEAERANSRVNRAATLKRGEVRGGGKKPWRQKGTGRARAGSIRSPIWRGGGITFGPSGNENYARKVNIASRRSALKQALSLKASNGAVAVIDDFIIKEGKAKAANSLLEKLALQKPLVIVADNVDETTARAVKNLPGCRLVAANVLNLRDVVNAGSLLFTKPALESLESRLEAKS